MDSPSDVGYYRSESFIKTGSLRSENSDEPKAPAPDGPRDTTYVDLVRSDSEQLRNLISNPGFDNPKRTVVYVKEALERLDTIEGTFTRGTIVQNLTNSANDDQEPPKPDERKPNVRCAAFCQPRKTTIKVDCDDDTEDELFQLITVFESDWETDYSMSDPRTPYGTETDTFGSSSYSGPTISGFEEWRKTLQDQKMQKPEELKKEQPEEPKKEQPEEPKKEQPEQPEEPKKEQPEEPRKEQPEEPKKEQREEPKKEQPEEPKKEQPEELKKQQPDITTKPKTKKGRLRRFLRRVGEFVFRGCLKRGGVSDSD